MAHIPRTSVLLSPPTPFANADWLNVPDVPGAYVIYEGDEVVYVGMAGRDGKGSLRRRLRDHATGQIVNIFAQYLFLARVQFLDAERIRDPKAAQSACRAYIHQRCSFRFAITANGAEARQLEQQLKHDLGPALNP